MSAARRPCRAHFPGEGLCGNVARPGKRKHALPPRPRDLDEDVRSGTEAIDAEDSRAARHAQAAKPDQSRAEQWRCRRASQRFAERQAIARIG